MSREADIIRALVADILESVKTWIDRKANEKPIRFEDILIIAPYNAQVFELQDRIKGGRIGTVDKFQRQQAPIITYSLTTSAHADAPRGMGFLYGVNRLNVATSRARALFIVVCSPALFGPECRTQEQMEMAQVLKGICRSNDSGIWRGVDADESD